MAIKSAVLWKSATMDEGGIFFIESDMKNAHFYVIF